MKKTISPRQQAGRQGHRKPAADAVRLVLKRGMNSVSPIRQTGSNRAVK